MQADLLGIPVLRPSMLETTALGAAIVGKSILLHAQTKWSHVLSVFSRVQKYSENFSNPCESWVIVMIMFFSSFAAAQADGIDLWENRGVDAKTEKTHYVSSLDKFLPRSSIHERQVIFSRWKNAIGRSLGWANVEERTCLKNPTDYIYASVPAAVFVCSTFLMCKLAALLDSKT